MKSKDQQLLEEAYEKINKPSYEEKSKTVKDLFDQIKPIADQLLAGKNYEPLIWEPSEEEQGLFKAYSQFALQKVVSRSGAGERDEIKFGNYSRGQIWGPGTLSPHASPDRDTIETYTNILKVLQNKLNETK